MPPRFWSDLNAAKYFTVGQMKLGISLVINNLFDNEMVQWVYGATGLPNDDGYAATLSPATWAVTSDINLLNTSLYNPVRDHNHDGYITDEEEFAAYKVAYLDFVDNPSNYGPPRQIKLGVNIGF